MKKILIPEDNDTNFILFKEMLKDMDVALIQAKNGLEAVQYCDKYSDVSLILMDINMPVMNGEEAAVIIKSRHPNIPIISQTAYGVYGVVADENKHCFERFITKPINVENLKNIIREYCFK
jgi:CheY-like chemotaxis protein